MNETEPGNLQALAKATALMSEIEGRDAEDVGVSFRSGAEAGGASGEAIPVDADGGAGRSGGVVRKAIAWRLQSINGL